MSSQPNSVSAPVPEFQSPLPWFAVRVRSNFERVTALVLERKGYREFLPLYRVRTKWSDRVKAGERVVFPGYVFCSFDPLIRMPILSTPGVINIVGVGKEPLPIPESELQAVHTALRSGLGFSPWPYLRDGDWVAVERGPLAGVEGRVITVKGIDRLVVSVTLLQRSIAAEIDRSWVRPAARRTAGSAIATPGAA